jgi:hypothetical protein
MAKQRVAVPVLLLVLTLIGVAALLELVGGTIMLPGAGMFVWIALGFAAFLGTQLLIFRMLGLRARADEPAAEDSAELAAAGEPSPQLPASEETEGAAGAHDLEPGEDKPDHDADWRAWRG